MTWQAIIKVDPSHSPERRSRDIAEGIGYAANLLLDEYGWSAERVREMLEGVADEITDQAQA
jgi:hypothetical protein